MRIEGLLKVPYEAEGVTVHMDVCGQMSMPGSLGIHILSR